jgi:hypothetical protein
MIPDILGRHFFATVDPDVAWCRETTPCPTFDSRDCVDHRARGIGLVVWQLQRASAADWIENLGHNTCRGKNEQRPA